MSDKGTQGHAPRPIPRDETRGSDTPPRERVATDLFGEFNRMEMDRKTVTVTSDPHPDCVTGTITFGEKDKEEPYKPEPIGPPADWIPPYRPFPRPTPSSEEIAEEARRRRERQEARAAWDETRVGQLWGVVCQLGLTLGEAAMLGLIFTVGALALAVCWVWEKLEDVA